MSREAMQQALEALEQWNGITNLIPGSAAYAIIVLKQALAEPEQPVAVKQMLRWVEHLKRLSDDGQHMSIPGLSSGACLELAIELEQFIKNTAPTPRKPLTPREIELLDGMIEVQLHHAAQCDRIANRTMAEKQKDWDMERVALLRKLKAAHGIGEQQ